MNTPIRGILIFRLSKIVLPSFVLDHLAKAITPKTMPIIIMGQNMARNELIHISIFVGKGNAWPRSTNIAVSLGATNVKSINIVIRPTTAIKAGYAILDLTFEIFSSSFSIKSLKRFNTSSKLPLISPEDTILTYRFENTLGYFNNADEKVDPSLISSLTLVITCRK